MINKDENGSFAAGDSQKMDLAVSDPIAAPSAQNQIIDASAVNQLIKEAVGLQQEGRLEQAEARYRAVLEAEPEHFDALHLLGVIHRQRGESQDALYCIETALAVNQTSAPAYYNHGLVLKDLNRQEEALNSFCRALEIRPDYAAAYNGRGSSLHSLQRFDEAVASYQRALDFQPDFSHAHNNLGNALRDLQRYDEAKASLERALQIQPDYAGAYFNLSLVLNDLGHQKSAILGLRRVLELQPDHPRAFSRLINIQRQICDWADYLANKVELTLHVQQKKSVVFPFSLLSFSDDPLIQAKCAQQHKNSVIEPCLHQLVRPKQRRTNRLRLGYLSTDFRQHALALLMAELFEVHDREQFEVIAFSFGPDDGSPIRRRLERAFDQFVNVRERSDAEVAQLITDMRIDIAIDLNGYTRNSRPGILAHRPAPIQVSYLGYPGTMGADFIDYILVDPFVVPADQQPFYTEKLVHLPDCYQVNDRQRTIAANTPSRADFGLPERGFVFCCFNNSYKLTPNVFDIWMRLLDSVPDSVLWLVEDNDSMVSNLRREAESRGVSAARLVFAQRVKYPDYLASFRLADLFLDTLPYNAGATASDALWVGLPVLTCAGSTFAGRMAGSLLRAVGLPELVTDSLEDYEAQALKLTRDPGLLASLREKLSCNRETAPLFDTDRFRCHIERAYQKMWTIHERGDEPEMIVVPPRKGPLPSVADKLVEGVAGTPDSVVAGQTAKRDGLLQKLAQVVALHEKGKIAGAKAICEDILSEDGDYFDALNMLGILLAQEGEFEQAVGSFRAALELNTNIADVHHNLGNVLRKLSRYKESEDSYRRAIEIKPGFVKAHYQLARLLHYLERFGEATTHYKCILELNPDYPEIAYKLGSVTMLEKNYEEAAGYFRSMLKSTPGHSFSLSALARSLRKICDWSDYDDQLEALKDAVNHRRLVSPFGILTSSDDAGEQRRCAEQYVRDRVCVVNGQANLQPRGRDDRLRLGYLSTDFRQHPVAALMAELFEVHDREQFEVIAFSFGPDDGSPIRRRLERAFDQFVNVRERSDAEVAQLITDMRIDIAIDLNGYTRNSRPGILAHRPAPIQVSYLGYPGTMGADFIDYILVDPFVVPADQQPFYTEKLVHLPDCYQVNDRQRTIAANTPSRADFGLPERGFVFCCFNNSYKLTPNVFDIWMRLLDSVPDSVLWLVEDNDSMVSNLRREAESRGVSAARLVFAQRVKYPDYLASFRLADLFLDTLPYNAGATASDALWAGLPILTCAGSTFGGRMAGSLLHAVGLPELVTDSLEEYEALALKLTREPERMAFLREKLARNRETTPLFDTDRFRGHIEEAYTRMWEIHERGDDPETILIAPRQGPSPRAKRNTAAAIKPLPDRAGSVQSVSKKKLRRKLEKAAALREEGKFAEAQDICAAIIIEDSNHFDALHLFGILHAQQGQHREALVAFEDALKLNASIADVHHNLGNVLRELNRCEDAIDSYRTAISLSPDFAAAYCSLANALLDRKRDKEAITCYQKSIEFQPDCADVHYRLGNALMINRRYEPAAASFRSALAAQPGFEEAYNNCGNALRKLKRYDEAISCYQSAIEIEPGYANAHCNLGHVLADVGQYENAVAHYRRTLQLNPDQQSAIDSLSIVMRRVCDWAIIDQPCHDIQHGSQRGIRLTSPFVGLVFSPDPEDQLHRAQDYVTECIVVPTRPVIRIHQENGNRIRLGYLSADFLSHATAFLMAELFERHDRDQFEVLAFSYGPNDRSAMRQRLEQAFDQFIDVRENSDAEVAQLMTDMGIDIAVDLKGHTNDSRPGILAYRPAPIQVNYLGYPGTMGANFIDYILVDPFVVPAEQQPFYTEKLVHLPECYQVNDSKREIADYTPSRSECGLPAESFVFCCFNNSYKLTPEIFNIWMRLINSVDDSVLWLLRDNEAAERNLRKEAQARGVDPQRLVFAPRQRLPEHLARHRVADLFLDTLPVNAHTTASDALWAGLPVLTCAGSTFAGRVAGSLLHAVGLPELVTDSLEEYESLALRLANEPELLGSIRETLIRNRASAPLFDTDRFRCHMEEAYTRMWKIHERGNEPRMFAVAPRQGPQRPTVRKSEGGPVVAEDGRSRSLVGGGAQVRRKLEIAVALREAGKLSEAKDLCEAIIEKDGSHFDTLHLLGVVYAEQGSYEDALGWLKKALEQKPYVAELHYNLGNVLGSQNYFEEAIDSYQHAVSLKPDFAAAHHKRAHALRDLQRSDEAIASYKEARCAFANSLKLLPDDHNTRQGFLFALRDELSQVKRANRSTPIEVQSTTQDDNRALIIGIGTGRCGSTTLTTLLRNQADCYCAHEHPPRLIWGERGGRIAFHHNRFDLLSTGYDFVGDVSHWWLPHIEYLLNFYPRSRVVVLKRDRQATIKSLLRIKGGAGRGAINHWIEHDGSYWSRNIWDECYPSYDVEDTVEAIGRYWDAYYAEAERLVAKYPEEVRFFSTEMLGSRGTQNELLKFCGFERPVLMENLHLNRASTSDGSRLR